MIYHQYSMVSQQLEDSLINALTLLEDTTYESLEQSTVNISQFQVNVNVEPLLEICQQELHSLEGI